MEQLAKAKISRDSYATELRDLEREIGAANEKKAELERQIVGLDGYIQAYEEVAKASAKNEKESAEK